jgi:hypothetical protein
LHAFPTSVAIQVQTALCIALQRTSELKRVSKDRLDAAALHGIADVQRDP